MFVPQVVRGGGGPRPFRALLVTVVPLLFPLFFVLIFMNAFDVFSESIEEELILRDFFTAMGGADSDLDSSGGWFDPSSHNYCDWEGITCTNKTIDGRVQFM